jgi:hypothetical protein
MRFILTAVLFASANAFTSLHLSTSTQSTRLLSSTLFFRDSGVYDGDISTNNRKPDFKQRMKRIVKQQTTTAWRPDNMKTAASLQEYANVIEEGRLTNRVVVVNFHATWCKVVFQFYICFVFIVLL